MPLVSVLTTSFNRANFIGQSIESVLASSFADFELIVVDDFSTDGTVGMAIRYEKKDPRVKVYVNDQNLGDYENRNIAASYAKGKYLKYLDSDDILYPHGLEVMVRSMEIFPDAGFGLASKPGKNPYPVCVSPREIYNEHFAGFGHFNRAPGSSIIKREVFLKEGGFSGERMVGDLEFWLRLSKRYSMVKFPFDLYWYRTHNEQEFQTDYAKKIYPIRTKQLIENALNDNACPLSEEEKRTAQRILRNKERSYKVLSLLKRISKSINKEMPHN